MPLARFANLTLSEPNRKPSSIFAQGSRLPCWFARLSMAIKAADRMAKSGSCGLWVRFVRVKCSNSARQRILAVRSSMRSRSGRRQRAHALDPCCESQITHTFGNDLIRDSNCNRDGPAIVELLIAAPRLIEWTSESSSETGPARLRSGVNLIATLQPTGNQSVSPALEPLPTIKLAVVSLATPTCIADFCRLSSSPLLGGEPAKTEKAFS